MVIWPTHLIYLLKNPLHFLKRKFPSVCYNSVCYIVTGETCNSVLFTKTESINKSNKSLLFNYMYTGKAVILINKSNKSLLFNYMYTGKAVILINKSNKSLLFNYMYTGTKGCHIDDVTKMILLKL